MDDGSKHYRQYLTFAVVGQGQVGKVLSAGEPPRVGELVHLSSINAHFEKIYRVIQITHVMQTRQAQERDLVTSEIQILLEEASDRTDPQTGNYIQFDT